MPCREARPPPLRPDETVEHGHLRLGAKRGRDRAGLVAQLGSPTGPASILGAKHLGSLSGKLCDLAALIGSGPGKNRYLTCSFGGRSCIEA